MLYTMIIEKDESSLGAYVPNLLGRISRAEKREAKQLIQEAIELHLEGMKEEGLIPEPAVSRELI